MWQALTGIPDASKRCLNSLTLGFPWWLSGKESTCQCRRQGFDSWSGKIPHATEQLSLSHNYWACALAPRNRSCWSLHALESVVCQKRQCSEKPEHRSPRVGPAHRNWRKVDSAMKTQHSQKHVCVCVLNHSVMSDSCDPIDRTCQAHLSVGFSRQEYWSGLPFPPPGDLPDPEIEPSLHCRQTLYRLSYKGKYINK